MLLVSSTLGLNLALCGPQRLRDSLLHAFLLRHELRVTPKQNVGAATGHIRGDRDHALAAGLSHDFGFLLVLLGVQDPVLDAFLFQQLGQTFRLFNRRRADQHRLAGGVQSLDLVGGGEVFFFFGAVNNVWILQPQHRLVGGNDHHFQLVDLVELGCFGFRRTGHASQFLVHAEIILEGDGGEGLVLAFDLDVFLGLDRLMQAIGPAAARHQAAGELVHDDDFAILHDVFNIAVIESVGLDCGLDVMLQVPVFWVGDIADAQHLLNFFPAFVGNRDAPVLFIHHVVAGVLLGLARRDVDFLALFELGDDAIDPGVFVSGFLAGAGNDERGTGFVDQDGVDFVDDGEVVAALHAIVQIELHVVAEIVETELVVGAVGDVGGVGFAALLIVEVVNDDAHGEAEKTVQLAHPLRVAFGQIVVDRDHMHTTSAESIQINGQEWRPGFFLRRSSFLQSFPGAEPCRRSTAHRSAACSGRGGHLREPPRMLLPEVHRGPRSPAWCARRPVLSGDPGRHQARLEYLPGVLVSAGGIRPSWRAVAHR